MKEFVRVTEAVGNFLLARQNEHSADLVARWSPAMETQLNVIEDKGERVEGRPNTFVWVDENGFSYEFWHIRIPRNAKVKPEWFDYPLNWPLDWFAGIGSTGWDWENLVSRWVGFDFDSIVGHDKGLSHDQLAEIEQQVRKLDYAEIRKSTSGKGLHVYVFVDPIQTANHTIHAHLGKVILQKMSHNCDYEFSVDVDACGGNMWIWHRKMSVENEGLKLLKPATRTLTETDLPRDWREQINSPNVSRPTNVQEANDQWFQQAMRYVAKWGQASQGERNNMAFRLAGNLAARADRNGNLPNENQLFCVMHIWNMGNNPPMDDEELRSCVCGGMNRGTPRERKGSSLDTILEDMRCEAFSAAACQPNESRKLIRIGSDLHRMVDEATAALGTVENTYAQGQMLVEITYDAEKPPQCLHDNGSPRLAPIPRPTLATRLSKCVRWEKYDGRKSCWVAARPDKDVVSAVHVASNWPGVPSITGIVSSPVLRADGSILTTPGYDPKTGLYFENRESYLSLMRPAEAIELLFDVVRDFPFETDAHRSAWLACLITMLARPAFAGSAPFFLVDANASRTGKGLLTDVTTMIAEGRKACRYSWSKDNEETRKLITTVGMSGAPYLLWDNIKGTLGGPALEQLMTTGIWADRLLSHNRQVQFPVRFICLGTSNNAKLSHDMIGRTCTLG